MQVYYDWTFTKGAPFNEARGEYFHVITDSVGNSWYDLMYELDESPNRWVIGTNSEGYVGWLTNGKVAESRVPMPGGKVVVTDSIPVEMENNFHYWKLEGDSFVYSKVEREVVPRTKEDIMADLLRLQEELKGM